MELPLCKRNLLKQISRLVDVLSVCMTDKIKVIRLIITLIGLISYKTFCLSKISLIIATDIVIYICKYALRLLQIKIQNIKIDSVDKKIKFHEGVAFEIVGILSRIFIKVILTKSIFSIFL